MVLREAVRNTTSLSPLGERPSRRAKVPPGWLPIASQEVRSNGERAGPDAMLRCAGGPRLASLVRLTNPDQSSGSGQVHTSGSDRMPPGSVFVTP